MKRISLLAFLSTGELGDVRCGLGQKVVEDLLGAPDDTGVASGEHQAPMIWRYGDIDVHFHKNKVQLISIERFSGPDARPSGGSQLRLDPWVIEEGVSLRTLVQELKNARLEHTEEVRAFLDQTAIRLSSGVDLIFSGGGPAAELECISRGSGAD